MKILFIANSRIGDAVLSTGILGTLLDDHPRAEITIACGPAAAPLFETASRFHRVIVLKKRRGAMHWWWLWRECVGTRWDLVVDLRNWPMSRLLRAGERRVLGGGGDDMHRVERLATVLNRTPPPAPRLWITEDHDARARRHLPPGGQVLALAPTAAWPDKQWDPARFAEAAKALTSPGGILPGAKVAVFGAADEHDRAGITLGRIPDRQRIDLVGKTDLLTVFAILRRCSLFIGNDSGLMHMAAAAGIPTLGLFGPSREEHYAPWGPRVGVVRTPESCDELTGRPGYDRRTAGSLMGSLTVAAVCDAATSLWSRCGGTRTGADPDTKSAGSPTEPRACRGR